MWSSLRVAVSGMQGQQKILDVASNNLSNLQMVGYKSRRANLVDHPPKDAVFAIPTEDGNPDTEVREVGQGAKLGGIVTDLTAGPLQNTLRALDVAIAGDGFIEVALPNGQAAYTRDGSLHVDGLGRLVTASGAVVQPEITVPEQTGDVKIEADGTVVIRAGSENPQAIGRLGLVRFTNAEGLEPIGRNLLVTSPHSGEAVAGFPGENGFAQLATGSLEGSNVETSEEYLTIMSAQRAYQLNLRALTTLDEMLQGANNLRRT